VNNSIASVVEAFDLTSTNTGATHYQIALLTNRIMKLSEHLKEHSKDKHTRHGLIKIIRQRHKLMNYLKKTDRPAYIKLAKLLNIRIKD